MEAIIKIEVLLKIVILIYSLKMELVQKIYKKFIGALIYMGIEKLSRIGMYWELSYSNKNAIYIISKERFKLISASLHMPIKDSDLEQ